MDVTFSARGAGRRGRRRKKAPPELLDILRETYESGTQANVAAAGVSETERNEFVTMIRNGAIELGKVARIYGTRVGDEIQFWMEDETP